MAATRAHDSVELLLCSMPFGLLPTPSLALGLLHASLGDLRERARQRYYSLDFAATVGHETYRQVSLRWEVGDWVFAEAAFPEADLDGEGFLAHVARTLPTDHAATLPSLDPAEARALLEGSAAAAVEARRAVPAFLAACTTEIERLKPRLIGFSCLFQQRLASIALARQVKERLPGAFVVFGGPECHGGRGLELLRQVEWIDAVVSGPGELVLPALARRVLTGQGADGIQGVLTRPLAAPAASAAVVDAPQPASMDDLPYPLFDDYFADLQRSGVELPYPVYLSLETSRGCWWGEDPRRHCVFCGLNGPRLCFRAKSGRRAVEELEHFSRTRPGAALIMTDSVLDPAYLEEVIPALAARRLAAVIQYETRPTLSREELALLKASGVAQIQPGVESLSTAVLRLMRKGTTAIANLQLLKWARELDLDIHWNLLAGIPGEPEEAYREMEGLIPLITHLTPPRRFRVVNLVRHSPMLEQAEAFGLTGIRPAPAYAHVFPFGPEAIANLAITFVFSDQRYQEVERYTRGVQLLVRAWKRDHRTSDLLVVEERDRSLVIDRRAGAERNLMSLGGLAHLLHSACHTIRSAASLRRAAAAAGRTEVTSTAFEEVMADLVRRRLVVREGDHYLSLALRVLGGSVSPLKAARPGTEGDG